MHNTYASQSKRSNKSLSQRRVVTSCCFNAQHQLQSPFGTLFNFKMQIKRGLWLFSSTLGYQNSVLVWLDYVHFML
jgi:hypothetical protein